MYRDALSAYLQVRIDSDPDVVTFCEMPVEWWPAAWYCGNDKRNQPVYDRPVVTLRYAIPGHPEAGLLWEEHLEGVLVSVGWLKVDSWCGVYVHAICGAIFIIYVDDLLLAATMIRTYVLWREIG